MQFRHDTELHAPAALVFDYLESLGAFERLKPPTEGMRVKKPATSLRNGSIVELEVPVFGPFCMPWHLEHRDYQAGQQFKDVQVKGPFKRWEHTHAVVPKNSEGQDEQCILQDTLEIEFPFGPLTQWFMAPLIRAKLNALFRYREPVMALDLNYRLRRANKEKGDSTMKVLVSGSTGLVGTDLMASLSTKGHEAIRLARKAKADDVYPAILWDPVISSLNPTHLEGLDAVVHLAGENIAGGLWTDYRKKQILESRTVPTRFLCETLAKLKNPPKVLVCASGAGYYGDRGNDVVDESSAIGTGFLADTCKAWEEATKPARDAGIRVVNVRIGMVLTPKGGALQRILPLFQLGGGGNLGSGKQYWSWITLPDLIGVIHHAIETESLSGPVNAVAPQSLTNADFTKTLANVLHRPAIFPAPAFAMKLLLGDFAKELLLSGANVSPKKLQDSGYAFQYPTLEAGLKAVLNK
jgi:uncharacterized protein